MDLFKYRDVIPLLYQTIIKSLPNSENNPEARELYDSFAAGNIARVKEIPRIERKQIFITKIDLAYSEDIASEGFGGEAGRAASSGRPVNRASIDKIGSENKGGFLIILEGYSPYKNINDLLDPAGAGTDKSKWGLVTRLENLDPNGPFKVYNKTDRKNFSIDFEPIDLGSTNKVVPAGIGVEKDMAASAVSGSRNAAAYKVLIDPMTEEVISREPEYDSNGKPKLDKSGKQLYRTNDHWFRMNLKLVWNKQDEKAVSKKAANR